jgi:gliding motility-associated-like protein
MPVNEAATVNCIALATAPTLPTVTDNCGNTLAVDTQWIGGTYEGCEGTRIYYYQYKDCEGNAHVWNYTYTIERNDFTVPVNAGSTVACVSEVLAPTVPTVLDNCGNVLTPTGPVVTASPVCEGTITYTYTFTDCEGNTHPWVYTYTIEREDFVMPVNAGSTVACVADMVTPIAPTVTDDCGNVLTPTGPVVTAAPACEGTVTYTFTYTDCESNTHNWVYTYTIEREDFDMPANEDVTVSCPSEIVQPTPPVVTDYCGNVLTPVGPVVSAIPTCEGDATYTWTYTDCEGNIHDWVYTYTVDYQGDLIAPAHEGDIVYDVDDAVNPGAPASIVDACGNTVVPVLVGMTTIPSPFECEGEVIWTYRYTACDGVTIADWTYTYTVYGKPEAPTGATVQEFCYGDLAHVSDLVVYVQDGMSVVWYDAVEDGNVIPMNTLLTSMTYFAEAVNPNGCVSETRLAVEVWIDEDCDDDGVLDELEYNGDTDDDGIVDYLDPDDDNDGIPTEDEDNNGDFDWFNDDCDQDGIVDYLDTESCDLISNAFSPGNGDGINDTWEIPYLTQFPDFKLEIYDRWGNIVYEYARNNASHNAIQWWNGTSNGRLNFQGGELLPAGTYFYIMYPNEGDKQPVTGWVYLNR